MRARLVAAGAAVATAVAVTTAGATTLSRVAPEPQRDGGGPVLQARQRAAAIVCSGPETLLAPDGGDTVDPQAAQTVGALVTADPAGARLAPSGRLSLLAPDAPDGTTFSSRPADGDGGAVAGITRRSMREPGAAEIELPRGGVPGLLSAVQTTVAPSGDMRGLVVTGCGTASRDSWLVGGSTEQGRRGRLLLANPAPTPALVDVTVHGPEGPVRAPAGTGVVVPARGEVALLVDALAPGLERIAVHVRTRTGRVVSTLHDTLLRGLVPGGADDVPSARPASRRQVLGGLVVRAAQARSAEQADRLRELQPGQPGASAIRVVVPGTAEGVVRIRLLGAEGPVDLPGAGVLAVGAGSVADLPLSGVPDGNYGAVVESDVPVLAAGLVGRAVAGSELAGTDADPTGKAPPAEFGWTTAGRALTQTTLVALPPPGSVTTTVTLTAAGGDARVEGRPIDEGGRIGKTYLFDVAAGSTRSFRVLPNSSGVLLGPAGGGRVVAAAVLHASEDAGPMLSVLPVNPVPSARTATVHPVGDESLGRAGG